MSNSQAPSASTPEPDSAEGTAPEIGYEQARAELREVVAALESGGQSLEDSLALWQRGEQLAEICQNWLNGARSKLDAAIAATEDPDY